MSGTLSRESSDVQLDGRGRVRRCKHCKFSCTDAKEFFHHQMMEHEEENDQSYATPNKDLPKLTQIRKKNSQSSQEERTEDIQVSDKPNGDTIIINNMVTDDEEADEDGRLIIADQNEDGNNSESTVVTPTRCGNIQNRTYVCSGCDFSSTSAKVFLNHQKDDHRFDIVIYECDICEYATKYKQKLPRHRKLHFSGQDLLVGEGMPGEMDEFSNNEFQNDESIDNLLEEDELPEDSFKDLPPLIDSNTVIVNPTDPDEMHVVPEIKKAKKRQEVDPAKYFEVVDDTGCKYACSSCGNVYKWRKSLNKHWKEKHGGEMPDNSRKPPGLVYLVNSGGHTICGRRKILANSVLNKSQNGSISLCDTQNSSPGTPMSAANAEIMISMSEYTSSTDSPITTVIPSFIGPFVTNSLQPVYPEASTPNMMDKNRLLKAKSQYTSRIRLQGQNEPLDFSVKKDDEALMQSSYMHIKSEPDWEVEEPSKVDDKDKSVLQCTKCSFVAKTLVDYSSHMTLHLNKRAFKCAECQEHFNGVDDLNLHFAEVHANRIQEHKEAIQRIPHGLQQTYHLLKMPLNAITSLNSQDLTNDNKKLKCNMCSFVAKWPAELQKHAVSHSEERPFMCMVCGSTYKWKWDLVKHFEKSHHTLPNPYKRREMNLNKNVSSPSFSMSKGNISLDDEALMYKHSQEDPPSKKRRMSDSDMDGFDRIEEDGNSLSHLTDLNIDVNGLANIGRSMGLASNRLSSLPKSSDIEMDEDDCSRLQISNIYSLQERDSLLGKRPINESTQRAVAAAVLNRLNMNNASTNEQQMMGMADDSSVILPYKCHRCEYRARWPSEITQHMKNHSEDKPYLCPRCSYRSKWKWDVVKHLKRCGGGGTIRDVIDTTKTRKVAPPNVMVMPEGRLHQQTPQPNSHNYQRLSEASSCIINDSALVSMAKMTMDKQDKSSNNLPRKPVFRSLINDGLYYCLECQFVGTSPAELKRHAVLHSENKPFMCEICGYNSRWKCDLKKHMRTYNHYTSAAQMLESQASDLNASSDIEDSEYRCEKCYFSTDQQHLYKAHLQVHENSNSNGNNSGRFKCKQCSFQVNDLASFLQHRVTHTNNSRQSSPAPSQNSPAASHTSESPKTDMDEARIKHPRKQIKTFHCSKCDFVCKRRDLLETHEMEHDGEDSLFKCVYCDAIYKDKDSLLDHISTHSDFNPDEWETFFMEEEQEENNNEPIESLQQIKKSEHSISTDTPRLASALAAGPKYMNRYQTDENSSPQKLAGGIIVPAVRKFTCEWCDATFGHVTTLYHHGKNVHPIELNTQEMAESARDFLVTSTHNNSVKPETKQLPPQYAAALFGSNHYLVNPSLMTSQVLSQVSAVNKTRPILPNNLDPMKLRKSTTPQKKAKSFQCTKCPFTAPNAVTYLRHIERHGSNCKHTCWFCDYSIDRLNLLYQHMKGTHTDQWRKTATTGDVSPKPEIKEISTVYSASEDNNTDPSNSSLLQIKEEIMLKGVSVQICSYDGKRVFKCKKCSYISSNAANTTNHARQHAMNHSNIEEKVETETVQAMNNLVKALRAQKEKKKSTPGQTHCTKCPFKSLIADDFEKHVACHDYNGMYRCEQCDFSTDQVMVLTQHMQLHENNQPMKTQGSKSFIPLTSTYNRIVLNRKPLIKKDSTSKLLSIQARTSLNKSRRIRYKCSRCPYNSFCKNNMVKHRRQHIVKSRFRCPICNYSATRDYLLFQHMKFHGGDTDQMIKELKDKAFDDVVMDPFEKNGESPENNHRQDGDKDQSFESYDAEKQNDSGEKTSIHQCQGCPYSTEVEIEYQKHIKSHFSQNLYRCDYCSFNVESLTPLLDHRMLHSKEDYFDNNPPLANLMNKLISDGVTSTSFNQPQNSPQPSKDEMRYTCKICPYKCNSIKSYSVHKSMHEVNKKFICDFCNWSVDRLNLLYQHRQVHSKEPGFENNPEEILFMNREYALESSTLRNPEDVLEFENSLKDEIPYSCSDCPFTTANKNSFINHKALHESPARHKCSECSYSVDKFTLMCQHKKLHEESEISRSPSKKRLKCSRCPYHSQNRQLLENHMKMHDSGHKYNCGLCYYSTDQLNLLQQHVKLHNDSTNVKPSKSPHSSSVQVIEPGTSKITCPQLYFSSTNDEILSDGSEEELKCDRCPFSTPSKEQLDDHEHRHNFKNRVSCPYCDFSSLTDLQILEHIQVHFPGTPKEALKLMLERRQKEPNNNTDADDKMALTVTKKILKVDSEPDSTVSESQKSRPADEKTEKTEESVESEELENSKSTTKVYVCQYCEREFDKKSNMIQHERQHLIGHQY